MSAMFKWTRAMRGASLAEIIKANKAIVGLTYVAGYVALDRISFIEPYASFGITPWNPNTGLSLVLVVRWHSNNSVRPNLRRGISA